MALLFPALQPAEAQIDDKGTQPLNVQVITASEASLYVNLTLIYGEEDAALVDVPFTFADAHRVVADVLDSGKNLKYVYVTHDHPDHFFGMQVLLDAFPNAEVISHPTVVEDIWRSIPFKVKRWGPLLGDNGPQYPTAPKAWDDDHFVIEGRRINILGPMQGDHHHATALYVPSAKALIAGDLIFQDIHLWFGETTAEQRQDWLDSLDELAALDIEIVVPGHQIPGRPLNASALEFSRRYIERFNANIERSENSDDLMRYMQEEFPDVQDVLNDFILPTSARVGMGEEPPWQE